MSERYRIICPECRTEQSSRDAQNAVRICPTCKKDITDSYEILFQPSGQNALQRRIAIFILLVLTAIIVVALASTYM